MMLTPAQVHLGQADQVLAKRHLLRMAAYEANPLRFISGPPRRQQLPTAVWINPPAPEPDTTGPTEPASEEVLH
jgi:putative transposase